MQDISTDEIMVQLDLIQPDWFLTAADEQDLREAMRICLNPRRGPDHAKILLRRRAADRLAVGMRAVLAIALEMRGKDQ